MKLVTSGTFRSLMERAQMRAVSPVLSHNRVKKTSRTKSLGKSLLKLLGWKDRQGLRNAHWDLDGIAGRLAALVVLLVVVAG